MTSINQLKPKENKGFSFICDFIGYRGRTPTLRAIAEYMGFKSVRSASLLIKRLEKMGYLGRTPAGNLRILKDEGNKPRGERVIELPLVGTAPCGLPMLAKENTEAWISVSQRIAKPGAQYFLLRAIGDSMNEKNIRSGDLLVVRQQPVAENGDVVIALIGNEATVKEFQQKEGKIILMPRSSNPIHKPMIFDEDFMVQGVVVDTLPDPNK
jgi:repressor LexA